MTDQHIHKFELAGLGKAPFRFVGMTTRVITYPDAPPQPSGTCQYCGAGIKYCCEVKSADGRTFEVGTDCVLKVDDTGLVNAVKLAQRQATAAAREAKRLAVFNSPANVAERARKAAEREAEQAEIARQQAAIATEQAWLIEMLAAQSGDFCQSIADELKRRRFDTMSPRVKAIVTEIYGKQFGGRYNSKKYWAAVEEFDAKIGNDQNGDNDQ